MAKGGLSKVIRNVRTVTRRHQPEILTGIGIAGMVTTVIMAVRATPKALDLMAEVKESHANDTDKKALGKDIMTKVAPVYIPATIVGGLSIACLIGANSVNLRRNAALATAYTLSESALREYQDKVVETIGEKKERSVRDAIAKDKIDNNPVTKSEVIITEKGNTLCYDALSGRYFKSDINKLKQAANELNKRMRDEMYISLNEYYSEIGLDGIGVGYELGWDIDHDYIDLEFSSQLADDGTPCLVVGYAVAPRYDYNK